MLSIIRSHAAVNPECIAVDPIIAAPLTYSELADQVADCAERLSRAHDNGQPIALRLDHGSDEAVIELAALQAGVPVLSLPTFFTEEQTEHAISECGATAPFQAFPHWKPKADRPAPFPVLPGTARVTFTSGSTDRPKGICLSASHMLAVAGSVVDFLGAGHAGRHLALLPPGLLLETVAGFFATMLAGGTYVCPPQAIAGLSDPFRPDFATLVSNIADWRITSLILVPEYLAGIVDQLERTGEQLPLLTLVAVGGARTPPVLLTRARAVGLPVRQGYGLTECGSVVSLEDACGGAPGSCGRPLGHVSARIADDGEILLSGELCLGKLHEPRRNGWLATGDIGRIDETGRLWIEGRKSNLIVTSFGRNISPEWVEAALLAQPEIAQAMVHGDGRPAPEALLVAASANADLEQAVAAANATLPVYARIASWREVAAFTPANGLLTGNGRLRRPEIAATWLGGEPTFFAELEAETARERMRFLGIPQVRAGLAGAISRRAYVDYLTQAWHHVRHTVPLLRAARSGLEHRPELAAALDQYVEEETGHDEWILADIAAAGGNANAARNSAPSSATHAMVAHAYDRVQNGNPVSLFGMIYVLESVSVALAGRGAAAVARNLGLPPSAFTYLKSHGALDLEHMTFFADQVNRLTNPADRAAVSSMARDMFGLFGGVFTAIQLEDEHAPA